MLSALYKNYSRDLLVCFLQVIKCRDHAIAYFQQRVAAASYMSSDMKTAICLVLIL